MPDQGNLDFFYEMISFVSTNPLQVLANYQYFIETFINLDSFIDYMTVETFGALLQSIQLHVSHQLKSHQLEATQLNSPHSNKSKSTLFNQDF